MMVIAILAVGLVVAVPSLQQMRAAMKADTHVNVLVRSLNYSRVLAITKAQRVMLCPKAQGRETCGKDWKQGINIYLEVNNQSVLHQVIDGFEGAELRWNRNSQKVLFEVDGMLKSQNGSFFYQYQSKPLIKKRVTLSSTGRVRAR